jgi:hypothetical protein
MTPDEREASDLPEAQYGGERYLFECPNDACMEVNSREYDCRDREETCDGCGLHVLVGS